MKITVQPNTTSGDPLVPALVIDVPDTEVSGYERSSRADYPSVWWHRDEVRLENGDLETYFATRPGGVVTVEYMGAVVSEPYKPLADGTVFPIRVGQRSGPFPANGPGDEWFIAYASCGARDWPLGLPPMDPMKLPDKGDPGMGGTGRARDPLPGMTRWAATVADDAAREEFQSPQFVERLQAAHRDGCARACHYRIGGRPWRATDGAQVGRYRTTGGMIGAHGRPKDGHGGGWTPDPMHHTVQAAITSAVFLRSESAALEVEALIESMMSQMLDGKHRPVQPARWYGRPIMSVAQAYLALGGWKHDIGMRLLEHLAFLIELWDAHVAKSTDDVPIADTFAPIPLRHDQRGDHLFVTDALVKAANKAELPGLAQLGIHKGLNDLTADDLFDSHAFDWVTAWMLGTCAGGFAAAIAALQMALEQYGGGEIARNLANLLRSAQRAGKAITSLFYTRLYVHGNPNARSMYNPDVKGWEQIHGDVWYKTIAPAVNVYRPPEPDTEMGVATSFIACHLEELAAYTNSELARDALLEMVDAHVDRLIARDKHFEIDYGRDAYVRTAMRRAGTKPAERYPVRAHTIAAAEGPTPDARSVVRGGRAGRLVEALDADRRDAFVMPTEEGSAD